MPQIMSVVVLLIIFWLIVLVVVKNVSDEVVKKTTKKVALWVTFVVLVGFFIFAAQFTAVNEIPRSTIDRSGTVEGREKFQNKMEEDAAKPIIKIDSTKKTGDKK
jgi:uncharacterized membrane protein